MLHAHGPQPAQRRMAKEIVDGAQRPRRGEKMKTTTLLAVSAAVILLLSTIACASDYSGPTGVQPSFSEFEEALLGKWNRLNGPSEHEVMHFWVEENIWVGLYHKLPEPALGFPPPDSTLGVFIGGVAKNFVCQPTFPFYPCQNVVQVVEGTTRYTPPTGLPFEVLQQHIVVRQENGQEVMWEYWVSPGNFACPWFRTFLEALAANPFPTHGDCIFPVASP